MFSRAVMVGLVAASLAGCARNPPPLTGPSLAVLPMTELPPPTDALSAAGGPTYVIGPYDEFDIEVFGVAELSRRQVRTDAAGRISFPLVGTIDANGMTPERLAQEIASRLRGRFVRDPQVTVNLRETPGRSVTVDGQVREPGQYPVIGRTSLMRAIAQAKGLSEFARISEVVVFRTVGTQRLAALYDLGAIRAGRYGDPEVFPNDVIVVGDSPGRRLFRDLVQASTLITTPIIGLLQAGVRP